MRFIPSHFLVEGMVLGQRLHNQASGILLEKGISLTESYIDRIKSMGYNGVYITDSISENIEIQEILNLELKQKAVKQIKETFTTLKRNPKEKINTDKLIESADSIVDEIMANKHLMVNMIDLKIFDDYTFYHSVNVAVLATVVGVSFKLNKQELTNLCLSGLLHDIGKMFVPKEILSKEGVLTSEEFELVKTHSTNGYLYLKEVYDVPITTQIAVQEHHERWDGRGYPNNKTEKEISLFGRLLAVADVYDALTSERPYRKAELPSEAMEYILGGGGTMFDAEVVKYFARKVAPYPVGTCVSLSGGKVGIVIENFEDCCIRPIVKIISHYGHVVEPYEINLRNDSDYVNTTITDIVNI